MLHAIFIDGGIASGGVIAGLLMMAGMFMAREPECDHPELTEFGAEKVRCRHCDRVWTLDKNNSNH